MISDEELEAIKERHAVAKSANTPDTIFRVYFGGYPSHKTYLSWCDMERLIQELDRER